MFTVQVAFLRVDTQTILSIDEVVVTRNTRITVRYSIDNPRGQPVPPESVPVDPTAQDNGVHQKSWQLVIKDVQPSDQGGYMCQVNMEPMISQTAYLHVTGDCLPAGFSFEPLHFLLRYRSGARYLGQREQQRRKRQRGRQCHLEVFSRRLPDAHHHVATRGQSAHRRPK